MTVPSDNLAQGANGAAGSGSGQTEGEGDLLRVADSQRVPRHSENLEGLDPRFRTKVEAMMTYLEDRGYDPHVPKGSGLRSAAEQAAKAAAGYSKIRSGGPHQFGMAADIVVFDPAAIDVAPPEKVEDLPEGAPRYIQRAKGIHYTIVNGSVLMKKGTHTGVYPGKVLRSC